MRTSLAGSNDPTSIFEIYKIYWIYVSVSADVRFTSNSHAVKFAKIRRRALCDAKWLLHTMLRIAFSLSRIFPCSFTTLAVFLPHLSPYPCLYDNSDSSLNCLPVRRVCLGKFYICTDIVLCARMGLDMASTSRVCIHQDFAFSKRTGRFDLVYPQPIPPHAISHTRMVYLCRRDVGDTAESS